MRPQSIVRFEQAYLASVLVGLINFAVTWTNKMEAVARDPRFAGNPQMAQMGGTMMIGTVVIGVLISLLLWYLVARRGSEVAKWILVVFLLLSAIGVAMAVSQFAAIGALSAALTLLAFALNAFAVWQLFQPDAKAWMGGGRKARVDPIE